MHMHPSFKKTQYSKLTTRPYTERPVNSQVGMFMLHCTVRVRVKLQQEHCAHVHSTSKLQSQEKPLAL
jgi:hypothetical protein